MVRSPISGTVIEKKVVQGQYVTEGQDLFLLADLSHLWLSAKVYEQELGGIKTGQLAVARFPAFPGRDIRGRIRFIDPVLDPATRTAGVRIELPNPQRPAQAGNVRQRRAAGRSRPRARHPEERRPRHRRAAGRLRPVGPRPLRRPRGAPRASRRETRFRSLQGLAEGEQVVTSANFLIDSQSQLATGQSIQWGGASEVKPSEMKKTREPQ